MIYTHREYAVAQDFYAKARPGTVIYTDPWTGKEYWKPLREIIPFKDGALDELPITTSYAFYHYYLAVHDGITGVEVTEGYPLSVEHDAGTGGTPGHSHQYERRSTLLLKTKSILQVTLPTCSVRRVP